MERATSNKANTYLECLGLCFLGGLSGFSKGGIELFNFRVKFFDLGKNKEEQPSMHWALLSVLSPEAFAAGLGRACNRGLCSQKSGISSLPVY